MFYSVPRTGEEIEVAGVMMTRLRPQQRAALVCLSCCQDAWW